jgi:hypothetical protein
MHIFIKSIKNYQRSILNRFQLKFDIHATITQTQYQDKHMLGFYIAASQGNSTTKFMKVEKNKITIENKKVYDAPKQCYS